MILDTSFLLDLKDGDEEAFDAAVGFYDQGFVQRVSIVSVMELRYGAIYAESEEELRRVRNLLGMYPLVDVDEATARRAADLLAVADREADGDSGVDNEDGLIAALAERFGEPVVTRNVRDFERLGVSIETY